MKETIRGEELMALLEELAPRALACDWDNPGLLVGRGDKEVRTILLTLDVTDAAVETAIREHADWILSHHPLIFRPIKQVNDRNFITARILKLIRADISCFAMHTNFDAAPGCMADLCADRLGLTQRRPLEFMGELSADTALGKAGTPYGIGCTGTLPRPMTARELADAVKTGFGLDHVSLFGEGLTDRPLSRIAICPGSGGSEIGEALQAGAELFLTGDISHHEGIDAAARGMLVMDAGHYGLEHIFMSFMKDYLQKRLEGSPVRILTMPEQSPITFF